MAFIRLHDEPAAGGVDHSIAKANGEAVEVGANIVNDLADGGTFLAPVVASVDDILYFQLDPGFSATVDTIPTVMNTSPLTRLYSYQLDSVAPNSWSAYDSGSTVTLAKNQADFTAVPVELEFYQDDLATGIDGKYFPTLDATADYNLPDITGQNGRRLIVGTDWAARLAANPVPNWVTHAATNATILLGPNGFDAEGTSLTHLIADVTNNQWIVRSQGDITLDAVLSTFDNDVDAIAGTVPGSLFQGSGAGNLADSLYRVRADGTRVVV